MARINDGVLRAGKILLDNDEANLIRALFILSESYFPHREISALCEKSSIHEVSRIVLATIVHDPEDGPWIQFWGTYFEGAWINGIGYDDRRLNSARQLFLLGVAIGLFRGMVWLDEEWGSVKNNSYKTFSDVLLDILALTYEKETEAVPEEKISELGAIVKIWVRPKKEYQQGPRAMEALEIIEKTWEVFSKKPNANLSPVAGEIVKQMAYGILGKINSPRGILLAFAAYNKALKGITSSLLKK